MSVRGRLVSLPPPPRPLSLPRELMPPPFHASPIPHIYLNSCRVILKKGIGGGGDGYYIKGNCKAILVGFLSFTPVLRIHYILMWIRIRIWIRGSMPLTNGSGCGCGSCCFRHWPSRCQQKLFLFLKCFCWLLFEGKVKLLGDRRIRIRIHTTD